MFISQKTFNIDQELGFQGMSRYAPRCPRTPQHAPGRLKDASRTPQGQTLPGGAPLAMVIDIDGFIIVVDAAATPTTT